MGRVCGICDALPRLFVFLLHNCRVATRQVAFDSTESTTSNQNNLQVCLKLRATGQPHYLKQCGRQHNTSLFMLLTCCSRDTKTKRRRYAGKPQEINRSLLTLHIRVQKYRIIMHEYVQQKSFIFFAKPKIACIPKMIFFPRGMFCVSRVAPRPAGPTFHEPAYSVR